MSYLEFVSKLSSDIVEKLKLAVETGRWENGGLLTDEQKESAMQAILLWDARNNSSDEPFKLDRHGELIPAKKQKSQQILATDNLLNKQYK